MQNLNMETKYSALRRDSIDNESDDKEPGRTRELSSTSTYHLSWFENLRRCVRPSTCLMLPLYIINGLALLILVWTFTRQSQMQIECQDPSLEGIWSPAKDVVQYNDIAFKKGFITDMSDYQGWPNDTKDRLWTDLYASMPVQVFEDEVEMLPNETEHYTKVGYEKDSMVAIDVFHQLHCLNMLRKAFYPSRFPEMSMWYENGTLAIVNWVHIVTWLPSRRYMMLGMKTYHRCRNFDQIRNWAKTRHHGQYSPRKHVENGAVVDYENSGSPDGDIDLEKMRLAHFDFPEEVRLGVKLGN